MSYLVIKLKIILQQFQFHARYLFIVFCTNNSGKFTYFIFINKLFAPGKTITETVLSGSFRSIMKITFISFVYFQIEMLKVNLFYLESVKNNTISLNKVKE